MSDPRFLGCLFEDTAFWGGISNNAEQKEEKLDFICFDSWLSQTASLDSRAEKKG